MKHLAKKTRFSLLIYIELVAGILCYLLIAAFTGLIIYAIQQKAEQLQEDR